MDKWFLGFGALYNLIWVDLNGRKMMAPKNLETILLTGVGVGVGVVFGGGCYRKTHSFLTSLLLKSLDG
jgi:hypothetical protein